MALTDRETLRMVRRLLLLQVLLNHRTLQGGGYLFVLWPWLRKQPERAALAAAAGKYLNAHPVFAALAAGALRRRLETTNGQSGADALEDWQQTLSGPLGLVGDVLIWDRWKPLVFAAAALVLLVWPVSRVWEGVAVGALIVYNAPLALLRYWGVREGYRLGADVLTALNRPAFGVWRQRLAAAGAVIAGLLLAAGMFHGIGREPLHPVQFSAAAVIALIGINRRRNITGTVLAAVGAALLLPFCVELLTSIR